MKTKSIKSDVDIFRLLKLANSGDSLPRVYFDDSEINDDGLKEEGRAKMFYDVNRDWSYPVGMTVNN